MRDYGSEPFLLGKHSVECKEMMAFQYLPIKMAESTEIVRERRLMPFDGLVGASCCDFVAAFGLGRFVESYVYLTAKHLFQGPGATFNRLGWHCDGFMTDDINYVWSNRSPTVFNIGAFDLSQDDALSLVQMRQQAMPRNDVTHDRGSLIRLDQFVVHRVAEPDAVELRTFFKLSVSRDKYDLEGNAHNYEIDYDWPMRPRRQERNIPQDPATLLHL